MGQQCPALQALDRAQTLPHVPQLLDVVRSVQRFPQHPVPSRHTAKMSGRTSQRVTASRLTPIFAVSSVEGIGGASRALEHARGTEARTSSTTANDDRVALSRRIP